MKHAAILVVCCLLVSGCASMYPVGVVYTEVKVPNHMATDASTSYTKVGVAKASSVLTLVATGDASLEAAIKNGGITKVKYVDYSAKNVLGIFGEYTTTVYGD